MPETSPILALPYLQPSQAQKHVTHNEALRRLDVLVQLTVIDFDATTPPAVPVEGVVHALGPAPTDAWAGQNNALATWQDGVWMFLEPQAGWRAWSQASSELRLWDGAAWVLPVAERDNLAGIGIGTVSDSANRLAVRAASTLLSHDGAGHQLKINKATAGDTAALLFQSGWTGHAEMGLTGNTDFAIKVSADGNAWTEALMFDAASGQVSGGAVQSDPADATAGKLMLNGAHGLGGNAIAVPDLDDITTGGVYKISSANAAAGNAPTGASNWIVLHIQFDAGSRTQIASRAGATDPELWHRIRLSGTYSSWTRLYGQNSILGTVGQSGGVPTGAIIEQGSNANGHYVRFADGTQICRGRVTTSASAGVAATFPAAFIDTAATHVATGVNTSAGVGILTTYTGITSTSVTMSAFFSSSNTRVATAAEYIATGRWV